MAGISRRRIAGNASGVKPVTPDTAPTKEKQLNTAPVYQSRRPNQEPPAEDGMDAVRNTISGCPRPDKEHANIYPFDVYTATYDRAMLGTDTRMDDESVRGPLPKILRPDADGDYGNQAYGENKADGGVGYRYIKPSLAGYPGEKLSDPDDEKSDNVRYTGKYANKGQGGGDRYRRTTKGDGEERYMHDLPEARGQHGDTPSYAVSNKDVKRGWKPMGRK